MKFFTPVIISAIAVCPAAFNAGAITVNSEAGALSQAVSAVTDPQTETELTVTGSLNAADFDFIRSMKSLRSLNLLEATIEAYSGNSTETGLTSAPAGELPFGALMSGRFTSLTLPSGITSIAMGALGGSDAETVVIPSSVTSIADGAFAGMKNLKTVTIPSSVTEMGTMVFKDCQALQSVVINAPLTQLPPSTFRNCKALIYVVLPSSMKEIGNSAFAGCSALSEIALPSSLQTIGDLAFAATSLEAINLEGVQAIGDWAFVGCTSLTDITTDASIKSLGKGAFYNNSSLSASIADIAGNVTELPDYLLYGASAVDMSDLQQTSISTVGDYALSGNSASQVSLPPTLSSLGAHSMERWENLTSVDAQALTEVPAVGESVWEGVDQPNAVLLVPASMLQAYSDAPQWQDFNVQAVSATDIVITPVDKTNGLKASFDGALLMLEADQDIRGVQLYDISGRCFTIISNYQSNRLTVDTAPFDARVFILRVILADGSAPVLKLAR